jgi:hypothetical protein
MHKDSKLAVSFKNPYRNSPLFTPCKAQLGSKKEKHPFYVIQHIKKLAKCEKRF